MPPLSFAPPSPVSERMGGPRWVPPRQEEGTPLASPPAATSVAGAVAQVDQKHRIAGVPRAAGGAAVQDPARFYGPTGGRDGHWCWHAELRLDGGVAARGPGEAGAFVDPPWVANPTLSVSRCAEGAAAAALPAARAATPAASPPRTARTASLRAATRGGAVGVLQRGTRARVRLLPTTPTLSPWCVPALQAAQAADALLLSSQPQLAPQHIHAQQAMCPSTSHGALQQAESSPLAGPSGLLPTRQPQSAAGRHGNVF